MQEEQKPSIVRRLEAGACGFIGSAFVVYGIHYFTPREEYYVPRILMPIFDLFGNIGLAIGILLLGIGLIVYALTNWRKHAGGTGSYMALIAASVGLFALLAIFTGDSQVEREDISTDQTAATIEEIKQMSRPQFTSQPANDFFVAFEQLLARYREHTTTNDTEGAMTDTAAFTELMQTAAEVLKPLSNDEKYLFSQYNAKLQMAWSEVGLQAGQ